MKESKRTSKICAFTGHRELGEDFNPESLLLTIENLVKEGVKTFLCGMAIGFDILAAEFVLSLKAQDPTIALIACIPCPNQSKYFSEEDKMRYRTSLLCADEEILLSKYYYNGCMQARDRYMADRADVLVTYCKKKTGGTAYTLRYFQKKYPEKEIIYL